MNSILALESQELSPQLGLGKEKVDDANKVWNINSYDSETAYETEAISNNVDSLIVKNR